MMNTKRFIKTLADSRGMTMAEVLFASVVLFGAIMTMLGMFEQSIDMLQFSTSRSIGVQLANEEMEDIRSRDYEQIYNAVPAEWPDDENLSTATVPPKYTDIADDSSTVLRSIDTSTGPNGILVERVEIRGKVNFWINSYVLWVTDAGNDEAFKRMVVRVSWESPNPLGEITLTSNISKETGREPRPSAEIIGIVSNNVRYFNWAYQDTTMGIDDRIRDYGGTRPDVYATAVINSPRAKWIDRVKFQLFDPDGDLVASKTNASTATAPKFVWQNLVSTTYDDEAGYLMHFEAWDDLGLSSVATLPFEIDNTDVATPTISSVAQVEGDRYKITWAYTPNPGDERPELARFLIKRFKNKNEASGVEIAAVSGDTRVYYDFGASPGDKPGYRVGALDPAGWYRNDGELGGTYATLIPGDIGSDDIKPSAVTSTTVNMLSYKAVDLVWDEVSGGDVFGYVWKASEGGTSTWIAQTYDETATGPTTRGLTDSYLKPGRTYTYTPYVYDLDGDLSDPGPSSVVTVPLR